MISPLAYIHPEAKIGENVEIARVSVTETLYFREPSLGPSRKTLNFAEKNQPLKSETTT